MLEQEMESRDSSVGQTLALEVRGLTKVYGDGNKALDNISFDVQEGEIFGVIGPNGAGKTTTIKIITTLTGPTSGTAKVFGLDVTHKAQQVRQTLAYVPQSVSVDGDLSAYENLLIFSKLFYVGKKDRDERIKSALEYMGLAEREKDLVKRFSGGMMRRLEIAQALVNRPRILILDEPSIGLDPNSRKQMWGYIKQLNREFHTTILITTHDMLEADNLCDRLAIMSAGHISVIGNPKELKKSVGGEILTVGLSSAVDRIPSSEDILLPREIGTLVSVEDMTVKILTENGEHAIPRVTDFFDRAGFTVEAISLSKPSLDDVFLKYAKTSLESPVTYQEARSVRRSFARHSK
jgi:ABC-2 type transport system ATP-binding protein